MATISRQSRTAQLILFGERLNVMRLGFERPLKKGEAIEVSYFVDFDDQARTARPYFAMGVRRPLKKLVAGVRFPQGWTRQSYKMLIFASFASEIPISEEEVFLPRDSKEARWETKKPRIGYDYVISWD